MREYAVSDAYTREQVLIEAESPAIAAKIFAERHPGDGDVFVNADFEVPPPGGTWQDVKVFPRAEL